MMKPRHHPSSPGLLLLVLWGWCTSLSAVPVVHPWRAAPEIVPAGQSFEVLFQGETGEKITALTLQGPHNQVGLNMLKQGIGAFVYDAGSESVCSHRLKAGVPGDSPAELYDLVVQTNRRRVVSRKAVKVIQAFKERFTVVHLTDAHISLGWTGDLETGHPPGLEHIEQIIKVVNIIGPDLVIHTGDNIMDSTQPDTPESPQPEVSRKWECFYDGAGGYRSFHGLNAPFFAVAGNHDAYKANDGKAGQYTRYNGLRVFGFSYGSARFLMFDDSLGKDYPSGQAEVLQAFLKEAGPGSLRVVCQHQPDRVDQAFVDANAVQLVLAGHGHRNQDFMIGATPTRVLVTKNAGRPLNDDPGWFRVLTFEGSNLITNAVMKYGDNAKQTPLLTLEYAAANNGASSGNSATLSNGFDLDLPSCRVRFVMKPGLYQVTGGTVEHIIRGDHTAVYDVRLPVKAKTSATVDIRPSL